MPAPLGYPFWITHFGLLILGSALRQKASAKSTHAGRALPKMGSALRQKASAKSTHAGRALPKMSSALRQKTSAKSTHPEIFLDSDADRAYYVLSKQRRT